MPALSLPAANAGHPGDQPLRGHPHPYDKLHWKMYGAEFFGTALLVWGGLSAVILLWGRGSPLAIVIHPVWLHRTITGFFFGSVGLAVTLSPLGQCSGAHINPSVTFAFWLEGKIRWRDALGYVVAQLLGGAIGALALIPWGSWAASVSYGATIPSASSPLWKPLAGEVFCTFLLVLDIFVLAAHEKTKRFTPFSIPLLFAVLVGFESPLSGTSTNFARSFGPALVAKLSSGQWIYLAGPLLGAALAVACLRLEALAKHHPKEARVAHPQAENIQDKAGSTRKRLLQTSD